MVDITAPLLLVLWMLIELIFRVFSLSPVFEFLLYMAVAAAA